MYTRCYTDLLQVIWVKTEIIIIIIKNELKPTLPLMNLYFIDFMTKFTFIFLSWPPSHTPFHWHHFPSGEEGKTTYFKKKIIKVTRNKRAPPRGSQGGFRPPLWLLSSAFSYLCDTGQEKRFPTPLRWDAGQSVFFFLLPPKVVSQTQESNSFVPVYFFTFPE